MKNLTLNIEDVEYNIVETSGDLTARISGVDDQGNIQVNNILNTNDDNPQVGGIKIQVTKKLFCGELIYRFNSPTTNLLKGLFNDLDDDDDSFSLYIDLIIYKYPILVLDKISTSTGQIIFQLDRNLLNRWSSCHNYSVAGTIA